MKPGQLLAVTVSVTILVFGLNLLLDLLWLERLLVLVVLAVASLWLIPVLGLSVGIVALLADLATLPGPLDSLAILHWTAFVVVPFYLASKFQLTGFHPNQLVERSRASSSEESGSLSTDVSGTIESMKLDPSLQAAADLDREQPVEDLKKLVTARLEEAREQFEFDNLLIYRLYRREAHLTYVLTSVGEVDRDQTFRPDVGQGVGWVLRHRDRRMWKGRDIDWRTLRYHQRDVDLSRVLMEPLFSEDEFLGVMVMEWEQSVEPSPDRLESFKSELGIMLQLEVTVKRLQRNQNQLKLMEELHRLNPVDEPDFESVMQRALELVSSFIPSEHVEFYHHEEGEDRKVLHHGRRQIYEKCMRWIQSTGELLRLDDVLEEYLQGEKLAKRPHLEMRSFLGGAVQVEDDLLGMICLDHSEPRYFTVEDERLLGLLLNQLSQALRMQRQLRSMEEEREVRTRILNVVSGLPSEAGLTGRAETVCERLTELLPAVGTAAYWRDREDHRTMRKIAYAGKGQPSDVQSLDRPLVRRLNEHPGQTSVSFSDLSRLNEFEGPRSAGCMEAIPVFDEGPGPDLLGFFAVFFRSPRQFQNPGVRGLAEVRPLLVEQFLHVHHRQRLKAGAQVDDSTGFMKLDAFQQELRESCQNDSVNRITVWNLTVPGAEIIEQARGAEGVRRWLEDLAKAIRSRVESARLARSYGGTFYGFTSEETDRHSERMENLLDELRSEDFPSEDGSGEIRYRTRTFERPFPGIDTMLEGLNEAPDREQEAVT